MKLTPLFLLLASSAYCQTTWSTYAGTVKDPVITFTQFGDGWNIAIKNTNAKFYLPNFKCPVCPTCPPVVVCPPPIDCNSYSPFVQALQLNAQLIDEKKALQSDNDKLIANQVALQKKYDEAVKLLKWSEAERKKYKPITILISRDSL